MNTICHPISFTSTVDRGDRVLYDVEKVGHFTLAWYLSDYATISDDESLVVTFGDLPEDAHGQHFTYRAREHAPIINRVEMLGSCSFTISDALGMLEAHADGYHSGYWLRASRRTHDGTYGPVPDRTRQRLAWIVATLADDFLTRDDAPQIWHEHLRRHARTRAERHRTNIANAMAEITEWTHRLELEEKNLAVQEALANGTQDTVPTQWPPTPPPWRSPRNAATPEGTRFLTDTVGALPPR